MAISYYHKLLGYLARTDERKLESLSQIILDGIHEHKQQVLQRDVTVDEIKWSIFSMNWDKALSPDGYSAHFFKHAWKTIERICLLLSTPFPQVNYSVRLIPHYIHGP